MIITILALIVWLGATASVQAATYTNADVAADLTNPTRWVGGVAPGNSDTAVWDNRLATPANCTNNTGGAFSVGSIRIVDPCADVNVTYAGSGNNLVHIDMAQATRDCILTNGYQWFGGAGSGNVTVASGRLLMLGVEPRLRSSKVMNINGQGTVVYENASGITLGWTEGPGVLNILSGVLSNGYKGGLLSINGGGLGTPIGSAVNHSNGVHFAQRIIMGNDNGTSTYNLVNGTLNIASNVVVGNGNGASVFNVTGGLLNHTGGVFAVGNGGSANTAEYIQSGNSVATVNVFRLAPAANKVGSFISSNGTFYAGTFDQLAQGAGAAGHVWLVGGIVTLPAFPTTRGAGAYADVTFDGGTLKAKAASTTYMQGLGHAWLTTNGAVFDTTNVDITINQALEDYSGQAGQLVKMGVGTLTLGGVNSFTGPTIVSNGTLKLTATNCLGSGTDVYLYAGATNNLSFTGTNFVHAVYINGQEHLGVLNASKFPSFFSGSGCLQTLKPWNGCVFMFN